MGVVKSLKALSEIPEKVRTSDINRILKKGTEYLLKHHIFKRSHDLNKISKPKWLKFGFPLMWGTDVLEILEILVKLDFRDKRMQESIDLVISKQDNKGKWKLENTSKWITLKAVDVLGNFYGNSFGKRDHNE